MREQVCSQRTSYSTKTVQGTGSLSMSYLSAKPHNQPKQHQQLPLRLVSFSTQQDVENILLLKTGKHICIRR